MPTTGTLLHDQPDGCNYTVDVHCTADKHGTRAAYTAGCRCPGARKANREYAHYRKQRIAQAAFGAVPPFSVPVADSRSVIEQLRGTGWTLRRIEATTGIGRDHLARINGKTQRPLRRVLWATHQRLAALLDRQPVVAGGTRVDAYPTWQQIRGLIALGYTKTWIAGQLGSGRALQLDPYVITASNADKVAALVDRYGTTLGPSDRARAYAAERGWTPDLLWEADLIVDDIQFLENKEQTQEEFFHTYKSNQFGAGDIDPVAVERVLRGEAPTSTLNRAEKPAAVAQLLTAGKGVTDVAQRLHMSGKYVRIYAARAGLDTSHLSETRGTITANDERLEVSA